MIFLNWCNTMKVLFDVLFVVKFYSLWIQTHSKSLTTTPKNEGKRHLKIKEKRNHNIHLVCTFFFQSSVNVFKSLFSIFTTTSNLMLFYRQRDVNIYLILAILSDFAAYTSGTTLTVLGFVFLTILKLFIKVVSPQSLLCILSFLPLCDSSEYIR